MSSTDEIRRGERARALLQEPLLQEALGALERSCMEAWRATGPRETEQRERLWLMLQLAGRFRTHFESLVESGRLAKGRLDEHARERRLLLR